MWVHGIDLAQEADFDLGLLRVRPARCEVEWNGVSQTLQRRVMQVLVALAQARGSVVSQDDLVIRCWRGLSVSDDAIYRCISKLRKLAADYPGCSFCDRGHSRRRVSPHVTEPCRARSCGRVHWRGIRSSRLSRIGQPRLRLRSWSWRVRRSGCSTVAPPNHHPLRVAVQPFETLSNSADARSLARRIPNEVVERAWRQPDCDRIGRGAGRQRSSRLHRADRDGNRARRRAQLRSSMSGSRMAQPMPHCGRWNSSETAGKHRTCRWKLPRALPTSSTWPFSRAARIRRLTDDSALSALLQTNDMIRDTHGGDWAQMIERAQGVVARHPEFAFGHSVLAAAYAEASESIDIPDRAQAMSDAARREANLTLKLDPARCRCICHSVGARADLRLPRARGDFAARHKDSQSTQRSRLAHYTHTRAHCSAMSGVCAKPFPSN